jgi:diguanylate cyclase with GGDEF domain
MPFEDIKAAVVSALRTRSAELVREIEGSTDFEVNRLTKADPHGIQESRAAAIAAIVDYSLDAIQNGGEWVPIPRALAEHARYSARIGIRAGVLARRCQAVRRQFVRFIREEIERTGDTDYGAVLKHLYKTYRPLWEHIIVSVEHEYEQEQERLACLPEQRRTKLVRRLLVEDLTPARLKELDYEVASYWHLGLITAEDESTGVLRRLQTTCEGALFCIQADDGHMWAWLSQRDELTFTQFKAILSTVGGVNSPLATGEPRYGLEGWRQTHREAQIAWLVARHALCGPTRCVDVLPVASAMQSHTVIEMYKELYILPLADLANGGHAIRKSLHAYVTHGRSSSSAGKAIGVTGRTIENHLKEARKALGSPLNLTALEIALTLDELGYMA